MQVLPDSLADALDQASEATALAIQKGANRCIVSQHTWEFLTLVARRNQPGSVDSG